MVMVCLLQRGGVCDVGVGVGRSCDEAVGRLCVVSDSAGVFVGETGSFVLSGSFSLVSVLLQAYEVDCEDV